MSVSEKIYKIRQSAYLSREAFAQEVGVSSCTVFRWEKGETMPNLPAMRKIKEFCNKNELEWAPLEEEWRNDADPAMRR